MVEFLNLLKQHSEALTIIFAGVVTLSTAFYAIGFKYREQKADM